MRRRHPRIVHSGDRQPHDARAGELRQNGEPRALAAQLKCDQKGCERGADGNQHRGHEKRRIVAYRRPHLHRDHPDVVHGRDADAHEHRAEDQIA
jgi:hypothetical protein